MAQKAARHAVLHTDGASLGNPGPAGAGFVLADADGHVIAERAIPLGETTVGVAEYRALIAGLHEALARKITHIKVISDSEFMCRQLQGRYKVKTEAIKPLNAWARRLIERFAEFEISHCPREKNERADKLAGEGARRSKQQLADPSD